jgi:hypothetical protein
MIGRSKKMSRKQDLLISELLQRPSVKKAASAAGIGESTAHRWLRNPDFERCYRQARQQVVEVAIGNLQRISTEATEVLREILNDQAAPTSARVAAARLIIEQSIRGVETIDLIGRIDALEQAIFQN